MNDDFHEIDLQGLPEPPPEAYEQVRRRVLSSIRTRRRIRRTAAAVSAVGACLLLLWGALAPRRRAAPAPAIAMRVAAAPPLQLAPVPHVQRTALHKHRRVHSRRALLARVSPLQPLWVKMQTDDPNVVILWLVD